MKVKVELVEYKFDLESVKKFTQIAREISSDVRLIGKDENGSDWDISVKSLLCSLIMSQKEQINREHTAHEVDWNTIWCVCEDDIYSAISEFVVVDNIRKIGG